MKNKVIISGLLIFMLFSCQPEHSQPEVTKWKLEIYQAEQNFAQMAKEKGIKTAFLAYAADSAVLLRNNNIINGIEAIETHFSFQNDDDAASLSWKPDFVDVAASGDLGYTYGKYIYSYKDQNDSLVEKEGVFHTVWKRQIDGSWKFVWD